MKLKNGAGFGLLETMVAAGVAGVLLYFLVTGIANLNKSGRSVSLTGEANSVYQGVQLALSNQKLCTQLLSGVNVSATFTSLDLTNLHFGSSLLTQVGAAQNGIKANSIKLVKEAGPFSTTVVKDDGTSVTMSRWFARIDLDLTKTGGDGGTNAGGDSLRKHAFYVSLLTQSDGSLYDCGGGLDDAYIKQACVDNLGGQYDASKIPRCRLNTLGVGVRWNNEDSALPAGSNVGAMRLENKDTMAALYLRGGGLGNPYSGVVLGKRDSDSMATNANNAWIMQFSSDGDNQFSIGRFSPGQFQPFKITGTYPSKFGFSLDNGQSPAHTIDVKGDAKFTEALEVGTTGKFGGNVLGPSFITPSDERLKRDIRPLDLPADAFFRLSAYRYSLKSDRSEKIRGGFLAQEVERVFPEAVTRTPDGYLAVDYPMMVAPLFSAAKELAGRLSSLLVRSDSQEERLKKLEREFAELKARQNACGTETR